MALDLQPQAKEVPHYSDGDGDQGQDVPSGAAWLMKLKPTMPSATILSPEANREYTETRLPMIPSPPTSSDNGP